jgi:Ni/Fe-hydrogenase subunit HybB-like protein
VVLAGVSGIGLLIVIAAILRWMLGIREQLRLEIFAWLGNLLMVLIITYLYFMAVELLTSLYTGHTREVELSLALLTGQYARLYWLSAAFLVIPFLLLFGQFVLQRYSLTLMVVSGLLVNLAAIGKRYLIVVPSQTYGTLLPYGTGAYAPTWVEYSIILSLFALGSLLYAVFVKIFPIMEVSQPVEGGEC